MVYIKKIQGFKGWTSRFSKNSEIKQLWVIFNYLTVWVTVAERNFQVGGNSNYSI